VFHSYFYLHSFNSPSFPSLCLSTKRANPIKNFSSSSPSRQRLYNLVWKHIGLFQFIAIIKSVQRKLSTWTFSQTTQTNRNLWAWYSMRSRGRILLQTWTFLQTKYYSETQICDAMFACYTNAESVQPSLRWTMVALLWSLKLWGISINSGLIYIIKWTLA